MVQNLGRMTKIALYIIHTIIFIDLIYRLLAHTKINVLNFSIRGHGAAYMVYPRGNLT